MTVLAERRYREGKGIRSAVKQAVRREWRKMNPASLDESFAGIWPALVAIVEQGQRRAATGAEQYVTAATGLTSPVGAIDPEAFAGIAADGRDLTSLLREPLIITKQVLARPEPVSPARALAYGQHSLERIAGSETADAGRTADQAGIAARPELKGYVRQLTLPSCARCAVLAGRVYRWNEGFLRHPQCDCRHIPVREDNGDDLTTDPRKAVEAGLVRLSEADRKAILDGADVSQVVNAHRGMYSTTGGRKLTREGISKRGWAGMQKRGGRKKAPRLRPEQIYKDASSRAEAISMLREHGYFVN